jgi:rhodanese-related sulfurtransferase
MQVNAKFVEEIEQMGLPKDAEILCICRSGARSSSALPPYRGGLHQFLEVAQGFEGDKDANGHRGTMNGWKVAGLPWVQS